VSSNLELGVSVATSVLSCGGLWTAGQYFMRRRERTDARDKAKRDADQQVEKDREDVDRRARERRELLAESQVAAQRAALESEKGRYDSLNKDYQDCRKGLSDLSAATGLLIDLFEKILIRLRPNGDDQKYTAELNLGEVGEVRRNINKARRHLR
jgi:hypothetical protein